MTREVTFPSVVQPAPQILDPMAVQQSLQNIAYQHNNLARDVHQMAERLLQLETTVSLQGNVIDHHSRDLTDLQQLVQFLEQNPGADIKDWARYEAVKERLLKAAGELK